MNARALAVVLVIASAAARPVALLAKGSSGHGRHSSGHSGSHGGGHGSGHATSRGSSSRGGSSHGTSSRGATPHTSGTNTTHRSSASRDRSTNTSSATHTTDTSVPGARPRDGRPIVGTAAPRPEVVAGALPNVLFNAPLIYFPRYSPGIRFDTFGFRSFMPIDLDSVPLQDAPDQNAPDPFDRNLPTGKLRLQVEPRDAEVFVDGSYAGIVDDFDGAFQRLTISAGPHRITVHAPGYQPLTFDVLIAPHQTTTYRGALQR